MVIPETASDVGEDISVGVQPQGPYKLGQGPAGYKLLRMSVHYVRQAAECTRHLV